MSDWYEDIIENSHKIRSVANQLKSVSKRINTPMVSQIDFNTMDNNIQNCLFFWTGHTFVGHKKGQQLSDAFQDFFNSLYSLLIECKKSTNKEWRDIANEVLYEGKLYRVLGYDSSQDNIETIINPEYNNIWVSWSKKELRENHYFNSKLYGCKTYLTCDTRKSNNIYGIDLTYFCVTTPNEEEVVFPTIKETIINVEYIDNKNREDSSDE